MYDIKISAASMRHLNGLPDRVRSAALAAIFGPISENPLRVGKPLVGSLQGLRSARRGDYRIVYEVLEDDAVVVIHRIQHCRDVYRPA